MVQNHFRKRLKHNLLLFITGGFFLVCAIVIIWLSSLTVPDLKSFEDRQIALSTKIYDRTGEIVLYDLHQDVKRTAIPFSDMGSYVKNATVAIEDSEFYQHNGIRLTSIFRAILANLTSASFSQGGSTITQQIVKNALLTNEKTITRKLKEWVLSLKIERVLSKEDILSLYLNESPYGGNIYGIEEASQTFFGKHAKDLTLLEASYLAAIPQAPTFYSPYGKNLDKLEERKNLVLSRMKELHFISDSEYDEAKKETVVWKPQEAKGIKAPHFVFFIRDYLAEKYGEDALMAGGLKVITTLDYTIQQKAEETVKKYALINAQKYKATNAGLVSIDPKTGQILAMVGSRDYFDKEIDGAFNITTAKRQPGSSFKPFVYATAFMKGYTPETVLFDVPTEFNPGCNAYGKTYGSTSQKNCYMPQNFTGENNGPMTIRNAFAQSINVIAVKMLYLVGIDNAIKTAEDMGIRSLGTAKDYGLTLVLGGGEVRPLDMASAYGVFANSGVRNPATGILKVENKDGDVLEEYQDNNGGEVIPKQIALQINDILSDNDARAPMFGKKSSLYIEGRDVAVKTGTTNSYRDAWIIGYTPSFVTAIWVGNNDNTPMAEKASSTLSGPMWNEYMRAILPKYPNESFEKPSQISGYENLKPVLRGIWQGGESFVIDKISGFLATEFTPTETRDEKIISSVHDILYWINKDDPLGPIPSNPKEDPQFNNWETSVQNWWSSHSYLYPQSSPIKPSEYDNIHTEQSKPVITITSPVNSTVVGINNTINVSATMTGQYPPQKMDVFANGNYIGTSNSYPFNYSFTPSEISGISAGDDLEIRAVIYDSVYNQNESSVNVSIQ